jgi:hypothetical protein
LKIIFQKNFVKYWVGIMTQNHNLNFLKNVCGTKSNYWHRIKMVLMIFSLSISHLLHHHTFVPHEHKGHITNYELIVFVFIPCLLSILRFCFKTWFKCANYQYKIPWNPWSVTQQCYDSIRETLKGRWQLLCT